MRSRPGCNLHSWPAICSSKQCDVAAKNEAKFSSGCTVSRPESCTASCAASGAASSADSCRGAGEQQALRAAAKWHGQGEVPQKYCSTGCSNLLLSSTRQPAASLAFRPSPAAPRNDVANAAARHYRRNMLGVLNSLALHN